MGMFVMMKDAVSKHLIVIESNKNTLFLVYFLFTVMYRLSCSNNQLVVSLFL